MRAYYQSFGVLGQSKSFDSNPARVRPPVLPELAVRLHCNLKEAGVAIALINLEHNTLCLEVDALGLKLRMF